ncbi:MAG TPA: D-aminoacylase, partial [Acidobacteriota bacterium]|nr:D-aminoacylase [Acidobacteriota bacterium]
MYRAVAALGFVGLFLVIGCSEPPADLVIRNGLVVDGSGNVPAVKDIVVRAGRIASIEDHAEAKGILEIDATGLAVSPGFIDVHSHVDQELLDQPDNHNNILQGITTVVGGNCGHSPVDMGGFFAQLEEKGTTANVACLIGHNSVREEVMGFRAAEASAAELTEMQGLVRAAMKAGALGLSTGLLYPPGTFASFEEVLALAQVVAGFDGLYASHIRNEEHQIWEAVDEVLRIGQGAGIRTQISHIKLAADAFWGQASRYRNLLSDSRKGGLRVRADQYPYPAGSATLENILPRWTLDGGREAFLERAKDPATRARIIQGILEGRLASARGVNRGEIVYISRCEAHPACEGKNLLQRCEEKGFEPTPENAAEMAIRLLEDGPVSAVNFLMSEADVRTFLVDPEIMISTDGGVTQYGEGVPHPRNYGTYPRLLGKYVREEGLLTLEEAIRKCTSLPASHMGFEGRGYLKPGNWADIVVFDPATIIDMATFQQPHQYPEGIRYVVVNGTVTVEGKQIKGPRGG